MGFAISMDATSPATRTAPKTRKADDAVEVASGTSGASFVAVQQWLHDLEFFASHPQGQRDGIIGRRLSDNAELADAPASAHVKRTAQESFEPEAFVLRRSMPWADTTGEGLMFVAFGRSLDAFVAQMRRMAGLDDGNRRCPLRLHAAADRKHVLVPAGSGGTS